jgi:LAO/AO transport system kinase
MGSGEAMNGGTQDLARAITLVESTNPEDEAKAAALLQQALPRAGNAIRVGITGPPGAGKSTFLDELGVRLCQQGHRVAVLAIDPTSRSTGGSILGDKTRMERLAREPNAFIRPSPGGDTLGGVARRTREAVLLCEAAGYDVVFVETIGVGQGEVAVTELVDCCVLLVLAGGGDELQGIKRGLNELADVFVVHKADGADRDRALQARVELEGALALLRGSRPTVLAASSHTGEGIDQVWQAVLAQRARLGEAGLRQRRRQQDVAWFEALVRERLLARFLEDGEHARQCQRLREDVEHGRRHPLAAARELT